MAFRVVLLFISAMKKMGEMVAAMRMMTHRPSVTFERRRDHLWVCDVGASMSLKVWHSGQSVRKNFVCGSCRMG